MVLRIQQRGKGRRERVFPKVSAEDKEISGAADTTESQEYVEYVSRVLLHVLKYLQIHGYQWYQGKK